MNGPGIPWYLAISAILFSTGIAGVLLRRSPLIVLLSLEIMLNASNLAFVGFSRLFGQMDGQVFALAVMAVAAAEVCVGLGLIVAMARRNLDLEHVPGLFLKSLLFARPKHPRQKGREQDERYQDGGARRRVGAGFGGRQRLKGMQPRTGHRDRGGGLAVPYVPVSPRRAMPRQW